MIIFLLLFAIICIFFFVGTICAILFGGILGILKAQKKQKEQKEEFIRCWNCGYKSVAERNYCRQCGERL